MKGIVFSEFIEMVEDVFSPEIADQIIMDCDLDSEGAYTSVGTYDHKEILKLVTRLSELTDTSVPELVKAFGKHLLGRFHQMYPVFFQGINNSFDFLSTIEEHVHVEVLKLYNDAELPTFKTESPDPNTFIMIYQSKRPLADLALGLIMGTIDYYQENISIEVTDLSNGQGNHSRFTLKRVD